MTFEFLDGDKPVARANMSEEDAREYARKTRLNIKKIETENYAG